MEMIVDSEPAQSLEGKELKDLKLKLQKYLGKLYFSETEDLDETLDRINQNVGSMGACLRPLEYGDVAWRCMECQKDQTCIICKSCFEKSDHTGHRVTLLRDVSGCCDCGDPEAWDQEHFCSDHKGYEISSKDIINKIPTEIKDQADQIFSDLCALLKKNWILLQNTQIESNVQNSEFKQIKQNTTQSIYAILEFLDQRIDEVPAFLYIIDEQLSTTFFEGAQITKNQSHQCCIRCFAKESEQKKFDEQFFSQEDAATATLCTCSVLDLCLQSTDFIDDETCGLLNSFLLKLFQSYDFRQRLTLSYGANYKPLMEAKRRESDYEISEISVRFLTSSEMAMLVFGHQSILDNILHVLASQISKFQNDMSSENYSKCSTIVNDLGYLSRQDCLQFCIQNTTLIEQVINILPTLYSCDSKAPRTTMVEWVQDGQPSEDLLNLEVQLIKILNKYLKGVRHDDVERNQAILGSFIGSFNKINQSLSGRENHGVYSLPLHRCFAYFFTRLLMFNQLDQASSEDLSEVYRSILNANLPANGKYRTQDSSKLSTSTTDPTKSTVHLNTGSTPCITSILKSVLKMHVLQLSFVHEIESKKWIYYGEGLERYPLIYYHVCDKMCFQDLANFQMILSMDDGVAEEESLTNFVIYQFGLDQQLNTLFKCLKNKNLSKSHFQKFKNFDAQKFRMQIVLFLRFMCQICLHEVSFLKQIYNRKEDESTRKNFNTIQQMWKTALRKEAVHILMLNKVNVSIQTLKEDMLPIFQKDSLFEDVLFEVSTQSRDIKNQVTFKLKDEYYGVFDPFHYVIPESYSTIFQMYESNQLQDKFEDQGLNDIVGDYLGNYSFATGINQQIMANLAKSDLAAIIIPLLQNWLQFRKCAPEEDEDFEMIDSKERSPVKKVVDFGKKTMSGLSDSQRAEIDQSTLSNFVDQNIAIHCLKLIILMINSNKTDHLASYLNQEFISLIFRWKDDPDTDNKTKGILESVLIKLQNIKPEYFTNQRISETKGQNEVDDIKNNHLKAKQSIIKKDKMKKRQTKMLMKMKQGGNKYLQSKNMSRIQEEEKQSEVDQEEADQCVFCQEDLLQDNFIDNPFGNFVYVQSSKLMYYSIQNTIETQQKALQNEDLAQSKHTLTTQLKQREVIKTVCNGFKEKGATHLNSETGAATVITNCKHHAHVECLQKYRTQQASLPEHDYQTYINGLNKDETACPICKCINNSILPTYSLMQLLEFHPELQNAFRKTGAKISSKSVEMLNLYSGVFDQLLQVQEGQSVVLKDFLLKPQTILTNALHYLLHCVNLVDIKGLQDFISHAPIICKLHSSLLCLLRICHQADNEQFLQLDQADQDLLAKSKLISYEQMIKDHLQSFMSQDMHSEQLDDRQTESGLPLLSRNICLIATKYLFCSTLLSSDSNQSFEKQIASILSVFYPLLRTQSLYAMLWRQNSGKLKSLSGYATLEELKDWHKTVNNNENLLDSYVQIELHGLRKIFISIYTLRETYGSKQTDSRILKRISDCSSDSQELSIIKQYLNLQNPHHLQPTVIDDDILTAYSGQAYLQSKISEFCQRYQLANDIIHQIPINLLLTTTYYTFSFVDLPDVFLDLQQIYYKRKCCYCDRERQDTATCLLCGQTMCWPHIQGGHCPGVQLDPKEALLSHHTRVQEGGCGVFLQLSTGQIILIQNGTASLMDAPYRNKYGELVNPHDKRWDAYKVDAQGGGIEALRQVRQLYMDFKIGSSILSQRTNPDSNHRIYLKGTL